MFNYFISILIIRHLFQLSATPCRNSNIVYNLFYYVEIITIYYLMLTFIFYTKQEKIETPP